MKKESIIFEWKEKGKNYIKEIERQDFYNIFDSIRKGFSHDNEISTNLCENIIPYASKIFINKDRNNQINAPFIQYEIDEKTEILSIIRYHKIVWSILDGFCKN